MLFATIRAEAWKYGCLGALAGLLAVSTFAGIQSYRLVVAKGATAILARDWANEKAERARAETLASEQARQIEHELATRIDAVAGAYERGRHEAQRRADRVVADLRAGNLRLREQWRGCPVSSAAADSGEPDGGADLRAAGAADLVRAGAEADNWIKSLQSACGVGRG